LLEYLECQNIHQEQNGNLIVARLPEKFDSNNSRSVQVKNNEYLNSVVRSRGIEGNIYDLVGYIEYEYSNPDEVRENIYEISCLICNALEFDIQELQSELKAVDWNYFLRPVLKDRKNEYYLENIPENKFLNENIKNVFIPELHIDWYKENISFKTKEEFDICYHLDTERISFPIQNEKGEIIAWKGRTTNNHSKKYMILYPGGEQKFYKSIVLYNYHRAIEEIQNKKQVIIFESEKSCMKCWNWGIKNCLSIMGSIINPVQVLKLKKIGLDIQYIFMLDKDKDITFIMEKSKINNIKTRDVKIMIDKDDILKNKDSPTDYNKEIFLKLFNDYIYSIKEVLTL